MYKRGDYISFMTKEPEAHLNEMFGYNDLTEDDFEKTEHVGLIMSVLDDMTYNVVTIRPLQCFHCTISESDILHSINESELNKEEKSIKEIVGYYPPNTYHPQTEIQGETPKEKCEQLAIEAMEHLFAKEKIASVEFSKSDFLKDDMLCGLQNLFKLFGNEGRNAELEEVCKNFKELLRTMHFKEYYSVIVGVYDKRKKGTIHNYLVAIDLQFDEVTIMRNIDERTHFFRSLGPNYDYIYNWKMNATRELMMKKL